MTSVDGASIQCYQTIRKGKEANNLHQTNCFLEAVTIVAKVVLILSRIEQETNCIEAFPHDMDVTIFKFRCTLYDINCAQSEGAEYEF